MIDGPCRAPSSPPDTPMPRNGTPASSAAAARRRVSLKFALPASMIRSSGPSIGRSAAIIASTASPAGTIRMIARARVDGRDQLLQRPGRRYPLRERPRPRREGVRHRPRAVENGDREPLLRDVERECRTHGAEPDQSDFRCHVIPSGAPRGTAASSLKLDRSRARYKTQPDAAARPRRSCPAQAARCRHSRGC